MFRFLARLAGYLFVAAGFVSLVVDGARSIANATLQVTALDDSFALLLGERYALLQPAVELHLHPLLWDPVLVNLLLVPTAPAALGLGFLLLWLGSEPEPRIGVVTRR